jgi:hypothetical protein
MVFDKTMKQRVSSYKKSQGNHTPLKKKVMNDVDAKNWQAGSYKR